MKEYSSGYYKVPSAVSYTHLDVYKRQIQYRELQHYDGMVIEDSDATEEEHAELFEYMKENEQIAHCNRVQMTKISAPKGSSNISIYLFVPERLSEFARDVTLKNRITGETYELTDEGAAISEKTASLLGLKVGDCLLYTSRCV